jgi:acylphosphatase
MVTMARARIIFYGKVQGVWFRANCQKKANEMDLKGWVRNLPDGTVESVVDGTRESIVKFIEWNRSDQPYAEVRKVKIDWEDGKNQFSSFTIN